MKNDKIFGKNQMIFECFSLRIISLKTTNKFKYSIDNLDNAIGVITLSDNAAAKRLSPNLKQ